MPIHGGTQVENKRRKGEDTQQQEGKKERKKAAKLLKRTTRIDTIYASNSVQREGWGMQGESEGVGSLALSATKACENNICAKYFTANFSRQEVNEKAFKKL